MTKPVFQVSFDLFHPLDHRCGSRRCWSCPGGPRNHAALWWKYQAAPRLRAKVFCARGWHDWCKASHRGRNFYLCWDCEQKGGLR